MSIIENANNIVTEEAVDTVVQAVEAVPVKSINWSKLAKVGGVVGAVVGFGVGAAAIIRHVKRKKQEETEQEAAASDIDNIKVAERDFVENDPEE